MGLFSWWKKKKKSKKTVEIKQAGLTGNVEDSAVREAFYQDCSALIDEAVRQSEQAKNEYGLVTAYLSDVEKLERISGGSKAEIEAAARSLLALEKEKQSIGKQQPTISEMQKAFLASHEEEIPKTIKWLREEEIRQRDIEGKMRYLAGEKAAYTLEHDECVKRNDFFRKLTVGLCIGVAVFLCLLLVLGERTGNDLRIPFLLTVIAGLVFAMYLLFAGRKNVYNMKVADIKRNKVIEVENKIKLRFVNCTWGVEYAYEKYHTASSMQLEMMWKEYLRIKEEEERNRKNERQQEVYRSTIIRELRRYGVVDAGIWVLQPQALLDPKEMVEVRHSLNVRRQKLREHIDYNSKQKERNEAALRQFAGEHPEYAEEMKPLFERYRLLRGME